MVEPRQWATLDDVMARARERGEAPFVLVLDSLEDPQNVGTLLRSAEACGVHGVLFPVRRSAPIGPSAIKASAGAVEHLLMVPLDDLGGGLVDLHGRGLRLVGADESAPLAFAIRTCAGRWRSSWAARGGASRVTSDVASTSSVRIPMRGKVGSLNAAVAGSVLLFEAAAQRPGGPPGPPASTAASMPPTLARTPRPTCPTVRRHPRPRPPRWSDPRLLSRRDCP